MLRLLNKHSQFRAPNETFSLVQSIQLSGKLSRLKNKHARKNVHASRLNANGSIQVILRIVNNKDKFPKFIPAL